MAHLFDDIDGDSFLPRMMSGSNEWFTPTVYIEAARRVMRAIELDPASCEEANRSVRASRYYTKDDDGLLLPWIASSVFVNPPYGRIGGKSNQELWTSKTIAEYESGNVKQAILLINACTGTACVQRMIGNYPICLVKGRIRFIGTGRSEQGPTHDNLFAYLGPNNERFIEIFTRFGKCIPTFVQQQVTLWDMEEEAS